jgi:D-alanyl-D-alanine carboxypeptidase
LLVMLAFAPGYGHDRPGASPQPNAHLRFLLDAAVRQGLPGASLRVTGPGIEFQGAAGVAQVATREPLSTEHAMYLASLGKTFTATIALQLCEEGRLDLDSTISAWLPEAIAAQIPSSDEITLRHLLSHRSGLADYLNDDKAWRSAFFSDPQRVWSNRDVVAYIRGRPLLFAPGSEFRYSNSNYILAGLIVERVTGQPVHALIRERILKPLGLRRTFHSHDTAGGGKHAHGHVRRRGRLIDTFSWYRRHGLADSGMHGTPDEIALFLRSLLSTDALLSEAMRAEMTAVPATAYRPSDYGLGLYVHQDLWGGGPAFSHDGRDPGYEGDMLYFPNLDLTIVLCANASIGKASLVYENLIVSVIRTALFFAAYGSSSTISPGAKLDVQSRPAG